MPDINNFQDYEDIREAAIQLVKRGWIVANPDRTAIAYSNVDDFLALERAVGNFGTERTK